MALFSWLTEMLASCPQLATGKWKVIVPDYSGKKQKDGVKKGMPDGKRNSHAVVRKIPNDDER